MQGVGDPSSRDNKAAFWKKNSNTVPGRASPKKESFRGRHKRNSSSSSFQDFQESTDDAWDAGDDEFCIVSDVKISPRVVQSTALTVITNHSQSTRPYDYTAKCKVETSEEGRTEALQRLASQKEPASPLHKAPASLGSLGHGPGIGVRQMHCLPRPSLVPSLKLSSSMPDRDAAKLEKFKLLLKESNTNLEELRELSWSGIPQGVRAITWRLLTGYLPANVDRRDHVLTRKREEYFSYVKQYYDTRHEDIHQDTYRQIHIDIPRMSPLIPLFQQEVVQEIFEKILYIWAIRHPASGYVQGMNDLVTPFFVVFLQEFLDEGTNIENFEVAELPLDKLQIIEADSFWCMSRLLDGIQDNYTFAQPGIQTKVKQLKELIQRINTPLHDHLVQHNIEYLQFSFRWMNNLLMRELPLRCTIRLWDTYQAEPDGFATFHLYVCAAFLNYWSKHLLHESEFQGLMLLLQNFDTREWGNEEISLLVAEAFRLKYIFADAPNHFQTCVANSK